MKSVLARQQGDLYQYRAFWLKACRLFSARSAVKKVGYEIEEVKYFDDVSLEYFSPVLDAHGAEIQADYYQFRWHASQEGSISCGSLDDPDYMNAKTSLLERLRHDFNTVCEREKTARFSFVTTHQIKHGDLLGKLLGGRDGEIRLDLLFGDSVTGPMKGLQQKWCEHLSIEEEELERILARLRLCVPSINLDRLSRELSERLGAAGLEPIDMGKRGNSYDGLIQRLHSEGRTKFDKRELSQLLHSEGLLSCLYTGHSLPVFGIRSFNRFTEHMEEETERLLDLESYFNGRYILSTELWNSAVAPQIREFVGGSVIPLGKTGCQMRFESHSSIAFATGYELDPKAGIPVSVIQKSLTGSQVWALNSNTPAYDGASSWDISSINMCTMGGETAVVLCVTRAIEEAVKKYVRENVPQVGRLRVFNIPQASNTSIQNGAHARQLAEEVIRQVEKDRGEGGMDGPLHFFYSAPNGLVFLLGRLARGLGPIQLYEHDFESGIGEMYFSSISLPVKLADNGAKET